MAKRKRLDFTADPPQKIADIPFYGYILDDEQLAFAEAIYSKDIDIVACNSTAGVGKDLVAIGTANIMVQYGMYDGIYYIVSPYGERKLGYIPGGIDTKQAVYADPLFQTLISIGVNPNTAVNTEGIMGNSCDSKFGGGYITFITDTFLRGVTLDNSIIILDECENFSVPQLKKTLTRVGKNTKVIMIGHSLQCDLDDPSLSGFDAFIRLFKDEERCAVCELKTNHRSWISAKADTIDDFLASESKGSRPSGDPSQIKEYRLRDICPCLRSACKECVGEYIPEIGETE